jgi:hypothetical protein
MVALPGALAAMPVVVLELTVQPRTVLSVPTVIPTPVLALALHSVTRLFAPTTIPLTAFDETAQ